MAGRVEYDEFGLFHENAAEFGLPYDGPPVVRRQASRSAPGRRLSALVWGDGAARARAPARRRPERPHLGHRGDGARPAARGHRPARATATRDAPAEGSLDVRDQRRRRRGRHRRAGARRPSGVVGMSLGGLTTIALADGHPDLVPQGRAGRRHAAGRRPGRGGDRRLRERARELRRLRRAPGPHHGVQPDPLGVVAAPRASCTTRSSARTAAGCGATAASPAAASRPSGRCRPKTCGTRSSGSPCRSCSCAGCASAPSSTTRPRPSCSAASPTARVEHVAEAGHSVQGDDPLRLAALLDDFIPPPEPARNSACEGPVVPVALRTASSARGSCGTGRPSEAVAQPGQAWRAWGGRRARRRSWGRPRPCRRRRGRRRCTRSCRSGPRPVSGRAASHFSQAARISSMGAPLRARDR